MEINLTIYRLNEVLEGDLNEIISSLSAEDEAKKISDLNNE